MMQYKIVRIAATVLMLLPDLSVVAAPIPNSGQTIRELQQQPELSLPKTIPPLQPASAPVAAPVIAPTPAPAENPAPEPAPATPPVETAPAPAPAPVPESAPEAVSGKTIVENKLVTVEYANFLPGTVRLKPEADKVLGKVLRFARKHREANLKIIGYTDNKSKPVLSLGYADSVRNYLVTKGVEDTRISIEGAGSANPVADNNTRKGRAKNRRVEIFSVTEEENKEAMPAPVAAAPLPATPPVETAPAPESATEAVSGKTIVENKLATIAYVNFVPGTVSLKPEAGTELRKVLKFARKNIDAKLKIIGYTDSKAKPSLSLGYADSVRNYLVTKGVAGDRISIEGAGSANPVADNNTRKGRAKNRRVEIFSITEQENKEAKPAPVAVAPIPVPEPVPAEVATPIPAPVVEERMMVKTIKFSGNSKIATAELESMLSYLTGSEHTLAELTEGAARITNYYHSLGYIVARAYIPPQEIKDGAVLINIQEGHIGDERINNQSRLSDQRASDYFGGISSGDVLEAAPVERALLLLNETPGVGSARASLQPGASVGATDLIVELAPSAAYAGNFTVDNYGNYYTGEYRLGAELGLNSPLKMGDLITLNGLVSNENLTYAHAGYQIPLGSRGMQLGLAYSDTRYHVGKEFAALNNHGTADIASLFAVYPFVRSQITNLSGSITLEHKQLDDVTLFSSEKTVQVGTLALVGNHQDTLGGAGVTLYNLSIASGRLSMDPVSLLIDELTIQTNGDFTRFDYNLNRLQRLSDNNTLMLSLSGQFASKNLYSSEQFSLGGAYGVRAYPQGEGTGDQGYLATIELRHRFTPRFQFTVFYDAGSVMILRDPPPYLTDPNTRSISGGGVGLNASIAGMQIKSDLAVRVRGGQPTSEPTTMNRTVRLWVELSRQF